MSIAQEVYDMASESGYGICDVCETTQVIWEEVVNCGECGECNIHCECGV